MLLELLTESTVCETMHANNNLCAKQQFNIHMLNYNALTTVELEQGKI